MAEAVDRRVMDRGIARGDAQQEIIGERTRMLRDFTAQLETYGSAMQAGLRAGIDYLLGIRRGESDQVLHDAFFRAYNQVRTDVLSSLGIRFPTANDILGDAKDILTVRTARFLGMQEDAGRAKERASTLQELASRGLTQDSLGAWHCGNPSCATSAIAIMDFPTQVTTRGTGTETVRVASMGSNYDVLTEREYIQTLLSSTEVRDLGTIGKEGRIGQKTVQIPRGGSTPIPFALSEPMMVNLWVDTGRLSVISQLDTTTLPNVALEVSGTTADGRPVLWKSDKAGRPSGGESVSSVLPAGTYTLTVRDLTAYPTIPGADQMNDAQHLSPVSVGIDIRQYNTTEIRGRISIPERGVTMPVSLRVAEFGTNGKRNLNYDGADTSQKTVSRLDPSKPVWVDIHGMDSHEDAGSIESIARELGANGFQVVTVNWDEAAKAMFKIGNDAPWTKGVGEWVASQLVAAGFDAGQINIVGHSHGTYVAFTAANKIMVLTGGSQINALVALDPAGNVPMLSGFNVGEMNFANVSRNSIAIEGSWISGNNELAGTADVAFQIDSPGTYTPLSEHSLPMTTFANILRIERLLPGQFPKALSLSSIMTPAERQSGALAKNVFGQVFEGIITIDTQSAADAYGDYLIGIPQRVESRQQGSVPDDNRSIVNPDTGIGNHGGGADVLMGEGYLLVHGSDGETRIVNSDGTQVV